MRYIIKLFCLILKIIEEIIMKLIPQFCHEDDSNVHLPKLCEHMDRFIGADDVTIMQGTPFDPLEGVIAVDEYDRIIPFTVSPSELENPCEVGVHKFVYMTENYLDERNVTVVQAPAPTFDGLTNITVGLDESFGTLQGVTATDAHGNAVAVTCVEGSSYTATQVGQQTLHYTATDACGNVGTAERIITVEAGHFEGLTDASVNQGLGFDLRQGVTAYTYSGSQTSFSTDPDAIEACELGEQTVTYTAMGIEPTDRTITVLPIADPTISGVSDPIEVKPSEEFDPLSGVTATDGNGIDITADVTVQVVTYRTVIYNDGTLIINEMSIDTDANITKHGVAKHIYEPLNADGTNYVWTNEPNDLWHEETDEYVYDTITRVEIGSHIRPTSIAYWFYRLRHCIEMDLTNLDTSRCTNMNYAFAYVGYSVYTRDAVPLLDLSMFDTSKVTTMEYMFNHLYGGKVIDISSWEVASTVSTFDLFSYCNLTETIYASNEFEIPATVSYGFFSDCFNLVGGSGTAWADHLEDGNTSKFARIDGGSSAPGYFTAKA